MTTPRSGSLRQAFRVDLFEGARIALRSLLSHRMRTVLTTIGIGVGVCTLLAIVTVIQGLNRSFESQMSIIGAQTMQVSKFPWVMRGDWWRYRNRKDIDPKAAETLKALAPHVAAAAPLAADMAELRYQGRTLRMPVGGATADFPEASGFQIEAGRCLTEAADASRTRGAVLGKDIVDGLFDGADPIGSRIVIGGASYLVVGVFERKGSIMGSSQDNTVMVPYSTFTSTMWAQRSPRILHGAT